MGKAGDNIGEVEHPPNGGDVGSGAGQPVPMKGVRKPGKERGIYTDWKRAAMLLFFSCPYFTRFQK